MFRMPFIATLRTLRTRAGLAALAVGVALMAAAFFSLPAQAGAATVATDQASYATGDMVIITGSGWVPGEKVALEIVESALIHPPDTLYAVANSTGNIYQEYIVPDHAAGQTFTLTAAGEASGQAGPTTFTSSASPASPSSSTPTSSRTATESAATVTTDKSDYAPGEVVYMTGSGWLVDPSGQGETV